MARVPHLIGPASESVGRRILRTPAAAEYVGLSSSSLEKKRLTGDGPRFVRLGGRAIGYTVEDLDVWLDRQRAETDPKPSRSR
jgi:predicted DNA-binding transcriptional regulator AlpA